MKSDDLNELCSNRYWAFRVWQISSIKRWIKTKPEMAYVIKVINVVKGVMVVACGTSSGTLYITAWCRNMIVVSERAFSSSL